MLPRRTLPICAAIAGTAVIATASTAAATPRAPQHRHGPKAAAEHVILVSVDGLHQSDLDWYVSTHPRSTLATLVGTGTSYTNASTPFPSDSFPGMAALATGGNPRTTGIYYDVAYNHRLLPPGTTDCHGATPGTVVALDESADRNSNALDAGQGLPGLPGSILSLTGDPSTLLNQSALPVDPATCKPIRPNQYLQTNTIFEVAKKAGLRTAWSDKHPAYQFLDGPSGTGIDDLFTPEINSAAPNSSDWTTDNASTQQYDGYKVRAVVNEVDGYDHARTTRVGTPAILGLNFQSVSTAQKLPSSDGLTGGYLPGTSTPGPLLTKALDFVDGSLGTIVHEVDQDGLAGSTAIVVTAKHGQSPIDPNALTRVDDGPIIAGLNAAWKQHHPTSGDLVAASTDDDGMLLWLNDRSDAATDFARWYLLGHPAIGNTATGGSRTLSGSGLASVAAGDAAARLFGVSRTEPRHPDLVGMAQHGVVYTGGTKKIAEHGGNDPQDRHVPIVVTELGDRASHGRRIAAPVETTSVAPSILSLLGLEPRALHSVQVEGTPVLPGLGRHEG